MNEDKQNRFLLLLLAFFALLAILFSAGNFKLEEIIRLEDARVEKIARGLANLGLEAKAVSVYDFSENKKLFGVNDDVALPIASLAKTMTILVALNNHKLNDVVNIPMGAISQAGDYGILKGEKWYMSDLAKATLIASANDGAYALTANDPQFVDKMNAKAKRLGMDNTFFESPTGLDVDLISPGGVISAADANTLAIFALREFPQIFWVTTVSELNMASLSGFTHTFKNTDALIGKIPNLLFSKTGFTDLAGGNLTVIFRNKNNNLLAITILGSTYEGRFSDMEKIVNVLSTR